MKKKIFKLVAFMMFAFSICAISQTLVDAASVYYGDVNSDGKIDTLDAVILMQNLAGYSNLQFDEKKADLNKDGKVDTLDAVLLKQYLAGYAIELPKADVSDDTPVGQHGKLSVSGVNLVDESGAKFQLKGVSTHGIAWFPQYVNKDAFKTLRDDWKCNVIRLAMYTAEYAGYCEGGSQSDLKNLVDNGVKYATELGMYAIVDWHILQDQNPNKYKSDAISFFDEMSAKYANNNNVIYEICNEPNSGTSWADIKSYADDVIKTIRNNDKDAIIIVGTPQWCQLPMDAKDNMIDDKNTMYAVHYYATTHGDYVRNNVTSALENNIPIFISECSICAADGCGYIDYESAEKWMTLIKDNNLSFVSWNLSNKAETSSLIASDCSKTSDWSESELSDTGKYFRNIFRDLN